MTEIGGWLNPGSYVHPLDLDFSI